ncbi:hypothetical protein HRR83_003125 [Exophiala dermatitidis]|uniref:Manganese/iron superoxide dismutase C-terminal domain-containing protein n=1 Tax=Exophiala dermatitidis TaxID=5970 RepID=A0AAN6EPJ9_EXODE|nr:hypothetical protein HRR75_007556 [Exophiala dermatitidis]KAJ4506333.1 hypothetical protein HRR73_008131 [Exophiala dermatitidis]KAJ4506914.1 hypothetical protein HRR74_008230 [Exophiala dermatitidis]KAJ4547915.1 hypothetical protein HRR76_000536 [Exophiala dermatitidis]KAJ4553856.1 hypothetical protein HRR77_002226 [Exophiala dermatitidis]
MITQPATRPQSLLRAIVKQAQSSLPRTQRRSKHSVPLWADSKKQERFAKKGVPGFLSPTTYHETYEKYTQHLCDRLNEWTQGTPDESTSAFDLHAINAHKPERAALYNHAAMANHTHFFWESLTDAEDPVERRPGLNTMRSIEMDFESVDHLRSEFLEVADAMFGNGFVWLMKPPTPGGLTILATYNAGSPYSEAAPRRDNRDMATYDGRQLAAQLSGRGGLGAGSLEERTLGRGGGLGVAGSFGDFSSARANLYSGALNAQPILCVNVWQHQYIPDYGVLGKRAYLTAWWDHIDWQMVERRHSMYETEGERFAPNRNSRPYANVMDAVTRAM